MAAPSVAQRRRTLTTVPLGVDWSHPLARGLVAYVVPAWAIDATGNYPVTLVGALTHATNGFGRAMSGWSTANYLRIGQTGTPIVGDAKTWTVMGVYSGLSATQSAVNNALYVERGSAGNAILNLNAWSSGAGFYAVYRDNAGTLLNNTSSVSNTDGLGHVVVMTRTDASTIGVWKDGRIEVAFAAYGGTNTFSAASLECRIGLDIADTSGFFRGPINAVGLWRRAVTANEAALLAADPFCMLRT